MFYYPYPARRVFCRDEEPEPGEHSRVNNSQETCDTSNTKIDRYRQRMVEIAKRQHEFEQSPTYLKLEESTRAELKRRGFLIFEIGPAPHDQSMVRITFIREYWLTDGTYANVLFKTSVPDQSLAVLIKEREEQRIFESISVMMPVQEKQGEKDLGIKSETLLKRTRDVEELFKTLDHADRMIRTEARSAVAER
jgi:hypothetical protein